jgi:DNA-binding response OmpR family regulator
MGRTVILVEDHATVRALYADALRAGGWRVLERPDARGLGELLLRQHVDAVVLDWTLPGPSGLTALQAIKRHPSLRALRVLLMTAHATTAHEQEALAAGAEQFLRKPLLPDALLAALDAPPRPSTATV